MDALRDPRWQSAYLAANGPAHVPWEPVRASLAELAEAADVLGRPDLAAALEARATPQLCRAHAPLLAVLRRVARDPLSRPLSVLPRAAAPSDAEVWAEAMQSIRDELQPAEFSASDTEEGEDAGLEAAEAAGGAAGTMADSAAGENAGDTTPTGLDSGSDDDAGRDVVSALKLRAPAHAALAPQSLSHAELVRELSLSLLGLSTLRPRAVASLSRRCAASVWARFDACAAVLAGLPPAERAAARAAVACWRCDTVVQLLCRAERLVAACTRRPQRIDTAGVNMFLGGDAQSPAVVHDGERFDFAAATPPELRHPVLLRAGEAAVLAARVQGARPTPAAIVYASPRQYVAALHRVHARNVALLMTPALRDRVCACWHALAGVFLGQDARTLMLLHELVHGPLPHAPQRGPQQVLDGVWPGAPFTLDDELVPRYVRELDSGLEAALGPGLERLFPHRRLVAAWAAVVDGFRRGDQEVELRMAARAADIGARIRAAGALEPFI